MEIIERDNKRTDENGEVLDVRREYFGIDKGFTDEEKIHELILRSAARIENISSIRIEEDNNDSYWSPTEEWQCESLEEADRKIRELKEARRHLLGMEVSGEFDGKKVDVFYSLKAGHIWFRAECRNDEIDAERLFRVEE